MPELTQTDINELREILGTSFDTEAKRAEFYLAYYEKIKDVDFEAAKQVLIQAQITTYSGFIGGAALLGNAFAKFAEPELYNVSLDEFSWDIADGLL